MTDVDKAVIGKLKRKGLYFEVLLDPDQTLEFKKTNKINMQKALVVPSVFYDAKKGDLVSDEDLQKVFGTTDTYRVAEVIARKGVVELTTEQRKELVQEKTKQIANIIAKKGINPQTKLPHPVSRIINAMEKAGVHVDPFQDVNTQVNSTIKSIKALIPIQLQRVVIEILIPAQHTGKVYSMLKNEIKQFKEEWLNNGSLRLTIDIPAGMQTELFEKVGAATHGNFKSKIIKRVEI